MPGPLVAVINESTVLTDSDVAAAVTALQHQVTYHWSPKWHEPCHLGTYAPGTAPGTAWQLVLLDDSDQAGALGYHDLTAAGLPLAKVFAKTDQQYGYNWTVTTSHELLEMLGDPQIDRCVQVGQTTFYALEVADACEADQYGYQIAGVTVSDFVLPAWFQPSSTGPYDFQGHISRPLQLLPGGYIGEWMPQTGWTQKTAETGIPPASRRLELRAKRHHPGLERSTR